MGKLFINDLAFSNDQLQKEKRFRLQVTIDDWE